MDNLIAVRRHLNPEQWKTLITECRTSGMSVAKWCKANGICEQTYYKNLKKFWEEMIESLLSPVPAETEKPIAFKPLEIQALCYRSFMQKV